MERKNRFNREAADGVAFEVGLQDVGSSADQFALENASVQEFEDVGVDDGRNDQQHE